MSSARTLHEKIFAKLNELQRLYDAGQITYGSDQYLDLVALQEFKWVLSEFKQVTLYSNAGNPLNVFEASQTRH